MTFQGIFRRHSVIKYVLTFSDRPWIVSIFQPVQCDYQVDVSFKAFEHFMIIEFHFNFMCVVNN